MEAAAAKDDGTGERLLPFVLSVDDAIALHKEDSNSCNNDNEKNDNNVIFVDGSWYLMPMFPNRTMTAREEFERGPRIAGATFLDIDDVADTTATHNNPTFPHMMPSGPLFESWATSQGITNDHRVVVYGQTGCPFVQRAWFQFYAMGHDADKLHLLDGSLRDWMDAGGPVDKQPCSVIRARDLDLSSSSSSDAYLACSPAPRNVVDLEEMKRIVVASSANQDAADCTTTSSSTMVVDARSPDRFYGRVAEPRPGLRTGHMPGATNLFFFDLLDEEDPAKLKPVEELRKILSDAGLLLSLVEKEDEQRQQRQERRLVVTCGSGSSACTILAAMVVCGADPTTLNLYDASWLEWGSLPDTPVITQQ